MKKIKQLIEKSSGKKLESLKDTIVVSDLSVDKKAEAIELIDKKLFRNQNVKDLMAVTARINYD